MGGNPTLTETCNMPELLAVLGRILGPMKWDGVCQADFIVEYKTGKAYLIDINPRLFGALSQTIAAGVNFPYVLYTMALNKDYDVNCKPGEGGKILWLEGEIARFADCLKDFRNFRKANFARDVNQIDYVEDVAYGDFKPFLFSPFCLLYKYYRQMISTG